MKVLKEITDWSKSPYLVKNHTYLIDDQGFCLAYRVTGQSEWTSFKSKKLFDRRYRKFKEIKQQ